MTLGICKHFMQEFVTKKKNKKIFGLKQEISKTFYNILGKKNNLYQQANKNFNNCLYQKLFLLQKLK